MAYRESSTSRFWELEGDEDAKCKSKGWIKSQSWSVHCSVLIMLVYASSIVYVDLGSSNDYSLLLRLEIDRLC
jgi:hypothetical protein